MCKTLSLSVDSASVGEISLMSICNSDYKLVGNVIHLYPFSIL